MRKKTKVISFTAVLIALSVVANIFSISLSETTRISLTYIPSFVAGIFLGPLYGFAVGALGDMMGTLIAPKGSGVWLFTITIAKGFTGFFPGLVFKHMKFIKSNTVKLAISFFACFVICTCLINSITLWAISSKSNTFWIFLIARIPIQLLVILINFAVMTVLVEVKPVIKYLSFFNADKCEEKSGTD